MGGYRRLLANRPFALLWAGATISLAGDAMTWLSLVWLTYELGGTAVDVGILAACYTAPVVAGGLGAGILLDRFDRRRLLIADNSIRGLVMLSVPLAASMGFLARWQLDAVALVYGLLYMVSLAGVPAMIPDLVQAEDVETANAMESLSFAIGGVGGPALAGLLIGAIGAASVLAIDAVSYFAFVACLAGLRVPAHDESVSAPASERAPAGGLGPAVTFVRHTRAILAITLMFMAANVGEGMLTVLMPVYARDVLGAGASGYGLLVSAMTAGSLAGSFAAGAVRWPWPLGRSIAAAQLAFGVSILALIVNPPLAVAAIALSVVGFAGSPLTIWAQTIRMRLIPPELRGRVFALLRTLMQSTPPIGALAAGAIVGGGTGLLAALIALVVGLPGIAGLIHPALGSASERSSSASTVPVPIAGIDGG